MDHTSSSKFICLEPSADSKLSLPWNESHSLVSQPLSIDQPSITQWEPDFQREWETRYVCKAQRSFFGAENRSIKWGWDCVSILMYWSILCLDWTNRWKSRMILAPGSCRSSASGTCSCENRKSPNIVMHVSQKNMSHDIESIPILPLKSWNEFTFRCKLPKIIFENSDRNPSLYCKALSKKLLKEARNWDSLL